MKTSSNEESMPLKDRYFLFFGCRSSSRCAMSKVRLELRFYWSCIETTTFSYTDKGNLGFAVWLVASMGTGRQFLSYRRPQLASGVTYLLHKCSLWPTATFLVIWAVSVQAQTHVQLHTLKKPHVDKSSPHRWGLSRRRAVASGKTQAKTDACVHNVIWLFPAHVFINHLDFQIKF